MGILYRVWWLSFVWEIVVVVWPGTKWFVSIVPSVVAVIGVLLGFAVKETIPICVMEWSIEMNTVWLLTAICSVVWFIGCVGYSIARARSGKLELGDMHYYPNAWVVCVDVRYAGKGEIKPVVHLVELTDETGNPLLPHLKDLPLQWFYNRKEVTLSEDGTACAEIQVIYDDGTGYLSREEGNTITLPQHTDKNQPQRITIKLCATAPPKCTPVNAVYRLERTAKKHDRYRVVSSSKE